MDDWDEEIDEESFENADEDVTEEDEVTPEEEAFLQGYNEADTISKDEAESADLQDDANA